MIAPQGDLKTFFKETARRIARAPDGLENSCALDSHSINVRRKVVARRLIFKLVCKPLYGPRPLILDLTTCTVEANSLRHPHGHFVIAPVFGSKQKTRRTDALCEQGLRCFTKVVIHELHNFLAKHMNKIICTDNLAFFNSSLTFFTICSCIS